MLYTDGASGVKIKKDVGMTPCQNLSIQEGPTREE